MTEKIYIEHKGKLIGYDANISKGTRTIKGLNYHLVEHISTGFKYLISEDELKNLREVSKIISNQIKDIEMSMIQLILMSIMMNLRQKLLKPLVKKLKVSLELYKTTSRLG